MGIELVTNNNFLSFLSVIFHFLIELKSENMKIQAKKKHILQCAF